MERVIKVFIGARLGTIPAADGATKAATKWIEENAARNIQFQVSIPSQEIYVLTIIAQVGGPDESK